MSETKQAPPTVKGQIPAHILSVLSIILSFVGMAELYILSLPADSPFRRTAVPQLIHYFRVSLSALITDGQVIAPPAGFGVQLAPEHLEDLQLTGAHEIVASAATNAVEKTPSKQKATKQAPKK